MSGTRQYKPRTEEELRDALRRFINRESVMTIPRDLERDADIILSDGINELIKLRGDRRLLLDAAREAAWLREVQKRLREVHDARGLLEPALVDELIAARNALDTALTRAREAGVIPREVPADARTADLIEAEGPE